jgi:hypothetical protein
MPFCDRSFHNSCFYTAYVHSTKTDCALCTHRIRSYSHCLTDGVCKSRLAVPNTSNSSESLTDGVNEQTRHIHTFINKTSRWISSRPFPLVIYDSSSRRRGLSRSVHLQQQRRLKQCFLKCIYRTNFHTQILTPLKGIKKSLKKNWKQQHCIALYYILVSDVNPGKADYLRKRHCLKLLQNHLINRNMAGLLVRKIIINKCAVLFNYWTRG